MVTLIRDLWGDVPREVDGRVRDPLRRTGRVLDVGRRRGVDGRVGRVDDDLRPALLGAEVGDDRLDEEALGFVGGSVLLRGDLLGCPRPPRPHAHGQPVHELHGRLVDAALDGVWAGRLGDFQPAALGADDRVAEVPPARPVPFEVRGVAECGDGVGGDVGEGHVGLRSDESEVHDNGGHVGTARSSRGHCV